MSRCTWKCLGVDYAKISRHLKKVNVTPGEADRIPFTFQITHLATGCITVTFQQCMHKLLPFGFQNIVERNEFLANGLHKIHFELVYIDSRILNFLVNF